MTTERTYKTDIHYIGHSEEDGALERLFEMLASHPLQRSFEEHGDFIEPPVWDSPPSKWAPDGSDGEIHFNGNFDTYAFAFSLATNDPALIDRLRVAVEANRARPDFQSQPDAHLNTSMLAAYLEVLGVGGPRWGWEPTPDRSCVLLSDADDDRDVACQLRHAGAVVDYVCDRRVLNAALINLCRSRRPSLGFTVEQIVGPIEAPEPNTLSAALAGAMVVSTARVQQVAA